jgi:hypothetical protein
VTGITLPELCAALYCAYAPADAFTADETRRIAFTARVVDGGVEMYHRVEFEGVTELTRHTERPDAGGGEVPDAEGGPLELSVIEVEGHPGAWRVWLNPWYLDEIEFRCTGICLNGSAVEHRGRWLQDDLPGR